MQVIIILTLTALVMGIILVLASKLFNKKNTHELAILNRLPNLNCGACGYGSCEGMMQAMLDNMDNYRKCRPLRGEKLILMENYVDEYQTIVEKKDKV